MTYHILIVDDEPHVLDALTELIEGQNHFKADIYRAESGREALGILGKGRMDLMISDIRMPEIDGLKLLDSVNRLWPTCKVLFLTAYSNFEYAYEGIQKGIASYILKTEDDDVILASIERALSDISALPPETENGAAESGSVELQRALNETLPEDERKLLLSRIGFEERTVSLVLLRTRINAAKAGAYALLLLPYFSRIASCWAYAKPDGGDLWILVQAAQDELLREALTENWLNGVLEATLASGQRAYGKNAHALALTLPGLSVDFPEARALMLACMNQTGEDEPSSARTVTLATVKAEAENPARHNSQLTTLKYIAQYVEENIESDVTLMNLAALTGYNADYLSYIFSRNMGVSFHAYVNKKKMERIRAHMATPEITLDEIAFSLGFKTRSYFNRFVKRESGCTPRQLRDAILRNR